MNYIFGEDEYEKSSFDTFEPSYKFEKLCFGNEECESLNNSFKQLDCLGLVRYEFTYVFEDKRMKFESVSEKANFGEDSESDHDQESIDFLDQIESPTNLIPYSNTKSPKNITTSSGSMNTDSSSISSIEKTKASTVNSELSILKLKALDITSQLIDEKIDTVKQTINDNLKLKSTIKRRNRASGYYRWNRKDDTKLFKELKEACNQSNISIEDFCNNNCAVSSQHKYILNTLVDKLQWRRNADTLLNRIRALSKKQTLSGRQIKALKKWIKQAITKKEDLSVESVANLFPGKSIASIKAHFDQILRSLSA